MPNGGVGVAASIGGQKRIAMICDDCREDKPDVVETLCPFAADVNNEDVDCQLCSDCYHERCQDI